MCFAHVYTIVLCHALNKLWVYVRFWSPVIFDDKPKSIIGHLVFIQSFSVGSFPFCFIAFCFYRFGCDLLWLRQSSFGRFKLYFYCGDKQHLATNRHELSLLYVCPEIKKRGSFLVFLFDRCCFEMLRSFFFVLPIRYGT
jgi:hypothetical protein